LIPKSRISVCHIIFRLDFGGLENGLVNLINGLPAEQFHHSIICLTHATDFRKRISRDDVPIFELFKRPGKNFGLYARMWRLLRQLRPDIVHTRNLPALDMLFVAKLAGVRHLIHGEHGLDLLELGGRHSRYNRLRRLSRWVVSQYVVVSADLARWLDQIIGIPSTRISLIYNGVDSEKFCPNSSRRILPEDFAPQGAFVVGTMGRLEPVKDQVTLARAVCRIVQLRPELKNILRLVIAGDGSLKGEILETLAQARLSELAWLPGFLNDCAQLYRCFDVFVLPSLREGISNTLLEAMASENPVVGTDVGGTGEIVLNGQTGKLIPPADPEALAHSILAYVDDPSERLAHGRAGRVRVLANFSLKAMIEKYGALYSLNS
jgi:sugar transferase (PEP-CTERM/EpsH1 system associated)